MRLPMVDTREPPTPSTAATGRIGEGEYADAVAEQVRALWATVPLILEAVSGIDDITATCTPPMDQSIAGGMVFWLIPVADNTGDVTLDVGEGPDDVVDAFGSALVGGDLLAGKLYLLLFDGVQYRALNAESSGDATASGTSVQTFTASGTWTKPTGTTVTWVRIWGAGGSGGRAGAADGGGGGGGGSIVDHIFSNTELLASEAVAIGIGGAAKTVDDTNGSVGGNSTFGSHLTAFGGGGGNGSAAQSGGGGGGGMFSAGTTSTTSTGG